MQSEEEEIVCPQCQNISPNDGETKQKKCFYNLAKDVWHCYLCNSKGKGCPTDIADRLLFTKIEVPAYGSIGRHFSFSPELLHAYQEAFTESDAVKAYITKRFGLSPDRRDGNLEIKESLFGLGYDPGREALVIPIFDPAKKLIGVKYRFINPHSSQRFTSEPGSEAGLYGLRSSDKGSVLLCEGELDAMSAYLMGFEGTIIAAQTNRITETTQKRLDAWLPADLSRIYVWPDDDKAGETLTNAVRSLQFEQSMVRVIETKDRGFKDLSELLEKEGIEKASKIFTAALKEAKSEHEKETFSVFERMTETKDFLQDSKNRTGLSTGIKLLDQRLGGGLLPYTLTAISAPGKTGKTTFLITLVHSLLQASGRVGFISLEMSPTTHVIPSLLSIAASVNVRRQSKSEIEELIRRVQTEKAYLNQLSFFDRYGTTAAEDICAWIREEFLSAGVTVFVLDHVGYSLKDIKDPAEHSKLSKSLRALTRELPIHIIAVVQPKQLAFGQKQITKHDLYGSVTWSQDINQLITLERSGENQLSLRLTDSHNPLARPSDDPILLFYDPETCQLTS